MKFNYKAAALSPVVFLLLSRANAEQLNSEAHSHNRVRTHHKQRMGQKGV